MDLFKRVWECRWLLLGAGALWSALPVLGAEVSPYRAAASQGGELKFIDDVPVLVVSGTPEQIGQQKAALTGEVASRLVFFSRAMLAVLGRQNEWSRHLETSRQMMARAPADHRAELMACAAASRIDADELGALNTMLDIAGSLGCSSLVVEGERSATGHPLFGRNLDMESVGLLQRFSLVEVCRPNGKHAFAAVGFPGVFGVISGINDQGLALSVHGVFSAGGRRQFDPNGTPALLLYRTILERCATLAEAEAMLREARHATALNVVLCDTGGGAVAEVSPRGVGIRSAEGGVCACTNHFRLHTSRPQQCSRYAALVQAGPARFTLDDVIAKLNRVQQGSRTIQSMVFEPATLQLHVALGAPPTSALPFRRLDLASLLGPTEPTRPRD